MEPSNILVTGGSGLIGQALIPTLLADGRKVSVLTRKPSAYPDKSGSVALFARLQDIPADHVVDGVINLAGARIVGARWTDHRKRVLLESRVTLTENLVRWMSGRETPPAVLVSGSAVGFYGDRGPEALDESAVPGGDFGAELCRRWESAATAAADLGTRVALIRTGLVLSASGGMLPPMLASFRLGLGAKLASGRQWMSWIHIDDQVGAIRHLLAHPESSGAYNLTAPEPVTNRAFSDCLARVLGRPRLFTAPAALLRLLLGESAELLVGGQKALPARLVAEGYRFAHHDLEPALRQLTAR